MTLREHVSLREISRLKTGGAVDYFASCFSPQDLEEAVQKAHGLRLPYALIGQGSRLLASDRGFPGVLIRYEAATLFFMHDRSQVIADAGISLQELVARTTSLGYSGLEFLTDVPGTLGGAIHHNRGRFGHAIGDYVRSATIMTGGKSPHMTRVERDWFNFLPGSSSIKQDKIRIQKRAAPSLVIAITLQLSKMNHESCLQKIHYFRSLQRNFPIPNEPSVEVFTNLATQIPDESFQRRMAKEHLSILTKAPLQTFRAGDIEAWPANPNYLLNRRAGSSGDALTVIKQITDYIRDQDKIAPEPCYELLGFWDETSEDDGPIRG